MSLLRKLLGGNDSLLVIFVCTANRARSPYAVSRLNSMLYEHEERTGRLKDRLPIKAIGAGVKTTYGEGPLPEIVQVAWERGLDISGHVAVPFDVEIEKRANLIITMEARQIAYLLRRFPSAKGRVFRLTDYMHNGLDEHIADIPDPTRGGIEQTRRIADIIDRELERIFPALLKLVNERNIEL